MERYRDWSPTACDPTGLGLDDRQDWWVVGVVQTRDSGCLDRSNYRSALRAFEEADPEGNDHEEHRFGHWGPGWFDIILVRPDSECERIADKIECGLADYPVVNESDFSELEDEEAQLTWEQQSLRYRIEACRRSQVSIFAARHDDYPYDCRDYLLRD